jgi:hypothetical protein
MHDLYREPDPDFEARLGERLRAQGPVTGRPAWARVPWRTAGVFATAVLIIGALFAIPSVRVSAQSFLDIFRVRNFTAVPVDPERIARLESESVDLKRLISDRVEVLKPRGEPVAAGSAEEAGRTAGFSVRSPSHTSDLQLAGIQVRGEGLVRMTADASILEEVLRLLDIRDARIPANLDGAVVQVRMPPSVHMRFTKEGRIVRFSQSQSPDVRLPPATDLEDLGTIALQITGMSRKEAERLARTVDWNTTLLVPVPASASSFRRVHVHGKPALLIESRSGTEEIPAGRHGGAVVMWAEDGMVYAMAGNVNETDLMLMAESVR